MPCKISKWFYQVLLVEENEFPAMLSYPITNELKMESYEQLQTHLHTMQRIETFKWTRMTHVKIFIALNVVRRCCDNDFRYLFCIPGVPKVL